MAARALVDSGFLAALAVERDQFHAWARATAVGLPGPWLTCEACVSEAAHLIGEELGPRGVQELYRLLETGAIESRHLLPEELRRVQAETARYHARLVDFADACLIVLSDAHPHLPLATVD